METFELVEIPRIGTYRYNNNTERKMGEIRTIWEW